MSTFNSGVPVILWVDDDEEDAQLFRSAFDKVDGQCRLVQVEGGEEALTYLQEQSGNRLPSIIVLDINMPLMNGRELLSELKTNIRFRGIPVVMVSTSNSAEDQAFCDQYNVMIMVKPHSIPDIEMMVKRIVSVAV